jgi:hypothetical protein
MYNRPTLGHFTRKEHYACFGCRKMFRQPVRHILARALADGEERVAPCPQCSLPMNNLGKHFKPPRQTNTKQWEKVKLLYLAGYRFPAGQASYFKYPTRLNEVQSFIADQKHLRAQGERLRLKNLRAAEFDEKRKLRARLLKAKREIKLAKGEAHH